MSTGANCSWISTSPARHSGPLPAVIFIHGGGWSSGQPLSYKYYCVRFPQMGYVVATVSYRLVGEPCSRVRAGR